MSVEQALAELAKVFGSETFHVNYGESEDMMRGFNHGYEDRFEGRGYRASHAPPETDPWRAAYVRGYEDGWETCIDHENGDLE